MSVSKIAPPDATATPVPTPTRAPAEEPTAAPTSADASEPDLSGIDVTDMEGLMQEVMDSPELMACLSSSMGLSGLMGLMGGEPTDEEIELILPCIGEIEIESMLGGLTGLMDSTDPVPALNATETPEDTERPAVTTQTALVRPEGVPWLATCT